MKKLFTLPLILLSSYLYSDANTLNETLQGHNVFSKINTLNSSSAIGESMRMNLYGFYVDSSTFVVDGTFTQYAEDYSNAIDRNDARKMINPGENISLIRGTTDLIIERRQSITDADTIFFRMWNMRKKTYRFEFVGRNLDHPGLSGVLEDSYLHTLTPVNLNDTTLINFTISDDVASYVQDRFRIIFKKEPLHPFTFTSVKAYQQNDEINVAWKTLNESKIKSYYIERSLDGTDFSELSSVNPVNLISNFYEWIDHYPGKENNYYRIRSTDIDGKIEYSNIVEVAENLNAPKSIEGNVGITLYPNPASVSNLNLKMINQFPGNYEVRLINSYGQPLISQSFIYRGGNNIQKINVNRTIPAGIYHLEITKPSKERQVITIVF